MISITVDEFLSVYLSELFILSDSILKDCDTIFDSLSVPEEGYLIIVDHKNQYLINSIIVSAGNIKKIVKPNTSRYNKEAKTSHAYRVDRGKLLMNILQISGDETLFNIQVRNNIEHFDERIDKLSLKKQKGDEILAKKRMVLYNISISSRNVFYPEPYYLKAYIVEEKTAIIDGKTINLDTIRKEAQTLRDKLSSLLKQDNPGGYMIPTT